MKLIRLLAGLAMILAGLAAPAPAVAADRLPIERPLAADRLRDVCTVLNGTMRADRLGPACDVSDGTILCAARGCQYHFPVVRRDLPPLVASCDLIRGRVTDFGAGQLSCDNRDGDVTVFCPTDAALEPWWAWPGERGMIIVCDVRWIPSEQPMT